MDQHDDQSIGDLLTAFEAANILGLPYNSGKTMDILRTVPWVDCGLVRRRPQYGGKGRPFERRKKWHRADIITLRDVLNGKACRLSTISTTVASED